MTCSAACSTPARCDVVVSLASAAIAFTIGTAIGLFSGYMAGATDLVVMRVVDVLLSFRRSCWRCS